MLASLGLFSLAVSSEEKFDENYKVEKAVTNDRQIASEKPSEREPSSLATKPASKEEAPKAAVATTSEDETAQPWLHKSDPGNWVRPKYNDH